MLEKRLMKIVNALVRLGLQTPETYQRFPSDERLRRVAASLRDL
jgi:hypothetical protein